MSTNNDRRSYIVARSKLPAGFPTHLHSPAFWEELGRVVGTFGFLEETLVKAIFAFTGTVPLTEEEIQEAFVKWITQLEKSLSDTLNSLIETYSKAVRNNPDATIENLDELVADLKAAAKLRNVICHGSWRKPDEFGRSVPLYMNKQKEIFETPINVAYLKQLQEHTVDLICAVINTVTSMGWQFPSSSGPGVPIFFAQKIDKE